MGELMRRLLSGACSPVLGWKNVIFQGHAD
jgi:hypothetical protein